MHQLCGCRARGIGVLLLSGGVTWDDVISERKMRGMFLSGTADSSEWRKPLVKRQSLKDSRRCRRIYNRLDVVDGTCITTTRYFYAHYGFASITAHVTAMYIPFVTVIIAAGAPAYLAVLSLAYFSNLSASLTHYGTTPAPIYFGSGYVTQRMWWRIGLIASLITIPIWTIFGFAWWKLLKLW